MIVEKVSLVQLYQITYMYHIKFAYILNVKCFSVTAAYVYKCVWALLTGSQHHMVYLLILSQSLIAAFVKYTGILFRRVKVLMEWVL